MKKINKKKLIAHCKSLVSERIEALQTELNALDESRSSDTKSSAGDKFETAREMLQQEENNLNKQLILWGQLRRDFNSLENLPTSEDAGYGSLVETSNGVFFLSGALGKVPFEGANVFCISMASPMGGALRDRSAGDTVEFNEKEFKVLSVR